MTSAIRPGRGDMTITRSERKTASGIEWVTNTMVLGFSVQIRSSSLLITSRREGVERPERSRP